jgi:hypothetical protein
MRGGGGVAGYQPMSTAEGQINFGDLTPYLTYNVQCTDSVQLYCKILFVVIPSLTPFPPLPHPHTPRHPPPVKSSKKCSFVPENPLPL